MTGRLSAQHGGMLVALLLAGPLAGCATILGIGDLDAGTLEPDAGPDATAQETGPLDGGAGEGACVAIALRDAGSGVCEVADGAACVPSRADSCGLDTDGSCGPSAIDKTSLQWLAPRSRSAACTDTQIDDYLTSCVGTNTSGCDTFTSAAGNRACVTCLLERTTTQAPAFLGFPLTGTSFLDTPNLGGCIALLEPCNEACGQSVFLWTQCQALSCAPSCSAEGAVSTAGNDCINAAAACPCYQYLVAGQQCFAQIQERKSAALPCVPQNGSTLVDNVRNVARVFCTDE